MRNEVKLFFLAAVFCCCFSSSSYSQMTHPPAPMADDGGLSDVPGDECAGDGTGSDPSVPPGLCLPINDYIVPLLLVGILFGAYKVHKLEKT